jgi:hypothetical protein
LEEQYRCYVIDRDGRGKSLARVSAPDPLAAVEIIKRQPWFSCRAIEVWLRTDRVLTWRNPTFCTEDLA